jgi:hypothetical protein
MALAGFMLRNGVSDDDVLNMLQAAWEFNAAPPEGLRDLEHIVPDTRAKLDRDEPVTGGRTLEGQVPGMPAKSLRIQPPGLSF